MLDLIKIIILSIVEGITEWLPISSTGHLILFGNILQPGFSAEYMEMFNVVIQLGAILAIVVIFFHKLWPFHTKAKAPLYSQFANADYLGRFGKLQKFADNYVYMNKIILWLKIAVSSIPALIVGLLFEDWLEDHMHKPVPVALMLIIFGVILILVEMWNTTRKPRITKIRQITFTTAFVIGCFQALSLMPGTSRSGATIIGALIIGLSRSAAAEYTFYMAIPAMAGASVIKLAKFGLSFTGIELGCLILGLVLAFSVSMLVVRFLMNYVKNHDFKVFGYYRIVLGIVVIICAAAGVI